MVSEFQKLNLKQNENRIMLRQCIDTKVNLIWLCANVIYILIYIHLYSIEKHRMEEKVLQAEGSKTQNEGKVFHHYIDDFNDMSI